MANMLEPIAISEQILDTGCWIINHARSVKFIDIDYPETRTQAQGGLCPPLTDDISGVW